MSNRRLLLLLLVSWPAVAQELPDVAPPAPAELVQPLGSRFVWELRPSLGAGVRPAGLAVQTVVGGTWFVVDEKGGVWLTEDEGSRWERVLRADGDDRGDELSDDEELLLEAETLQDEQIENAESQIDESDPDAIPGDEPFADEAVAPADELEDTEDVEIEDVDVLQGDLLVGDGGEGRRARPVVWVDPADVDRVFVGRADGVWRSSDSGRTWERVSTTSSLDPQVTTFGRGQDGALIAGTVDGVRFSLDDGATWIDAVDATDGAHVHAIVQEAGAYWAATTKGLFRSGNGFGWERVPLPDSAEARVVVADSNWDTGFWVATAGALLRTDDGGASFYVAGRQPLRGLRDMVSLDEPGHLLAISDDGVWESMDGGVTWNTADRQLGDPDVRALAFADSGAVIATPRGVWRLVAPRSVVIPELRRKEQLSLPETVQASIARHGMDLDLLSLSRLGVVSRLVPGVLLTFDYGPAANRDVDYVSASTTDSFDNDWSLTAKLCWGGGCGVSSGTGSIDFSDSASSSYVSGGEVFNEGAPVAAAANVAQLVRSYRRYLADHVADAWLSRVHLLNESAAVRELPLRDQVLHTLQIAELDARLDALTDGAFLRSLSRPEESP
jgi:hypothetical protein